VLAEGLHDLRRFVQAQQARVDENARQLVADRAMDERGGYRRIDAARQAENDFLAADLGANLRHRLADIARHRPVAGAAADVAHETRQYRLALLRVRHFRMKLNGIHAPGLVHHAGDRRCVIARHQREARRQCGHLVAVAHPYVEQPLTFGAHSILNPG
jgi:hypothetical protein